MFLETGDEKMDILERVRTSAEECNSNDIEKMNKFAFFCQDNEYDGQRVPFYASFAALNSSLCLRGGLHIYIYIYIYIYMYEDVAFIYFQKAQDAGAQGVDQAG